MSIKYEILLRILDQLRNEAAGSPVESRYLSPSDDQTKVDQARARAFVHLYLKVGHGLLDFKERERLITDGANDGGIDGYYIDTSARVVYLIQSKFRTTSKNFHEKQISVEELLSMDVIRISEGHDQDESGNKYNGKILQLIREISEIADIARYKYQVVVLANLDGVPDSQLRRLVGSFPIKIINYEKCFKELVFPLICGNFFSESEVIIHLDLSNKSAGTKISYSVGTRFGECEITVLFVPTIEIAKTFSKYKNAMLTFNPRSYLELSGAKVNDAIKETILNNNSNEFALYNNGITMLSDETDINERVGQKNKARLYVKNPQILNGGQTAYTLSRLYEEKLNTRDISVFDGKEVLLKVITLIENSNKNALEKVQLIEEISTATNQQTPVLTADRYSNDHLHVDLQARIFDISGLLYERKRGEFSEGIASGYIKQESIIERNMFLRIYSAANGRINEAVERKLFLRVSATAALQPTDQELLKCLFGVHCYRFLLPKYPFRTVGRKNREPYGQIYAMTKIYMPDNPGEFEIRAKASLAPFGELWQQFVDKYSSIPDSPYLREKKDAKTGQMLTYFSDARWFKSGRFQADVIDHFSLITP